MNSLTCITRLSYIKTFFLFYSLILLYNISEIIFIICKYITVVNYLETKVCLQEIAAVSNKHLK